MPAALLLGEMGRGSQAGEADAQRPARRVGHEAARPLQPSLGEEPP